MLKSKVGSLTTAFALALFGATASFAADSPEGSSAEIAKKLVTKTLPGGPGSIAVGSIAHSDGTCSELTRFLEEEMVDALFNANTGNYNIIERSQLNAIFRELELVFDGTIAPDTAVKIGQVKGVRGLVSGKITEYSDRILFRVRLINTKDGTIFSSSKSEFPITQPVRDLSKIRSRELCGYSAAPASTTASSQSTTAQTNATTTPSAVGGPASAYEGNGYVVRVRNLSFAKNRNEIAVALRITNTSEKDMSFSYIKSTLAASDDNGNIFTWKDVWSGLRGCGHSSYSSCIDPKNERTTGIAAGKSAQFTFNLEAGKIEKVGLLTIGFEVVHNPDTSENSDWGTASIGLFDLPVKSK